MTIGGWILLLMVLIAPASYADEDNLSVTLNRLTLETVSKIANGAIAACRKEGIQISVTVVDRDGTVQIILRDTIAAPISLKISRQKAFTAANFNVPTSALGDRANSPIGRVEPLLMSAGGIPIQAGGQLLGAIGVSGAPSGVMDEACAQAGLDLVIDDLEMGL